MSKLKVRKLVSVIGLMIFIWSIFIASVYSEDNRIPEIQQYKRWKKVNREPWKQDTLFARDCNMPMSEIETIEGKDGSIKNPHIDKYINVYVNEVGKKAMIERYPNFPVGSIIVKEKFSLISPSDIEAITIMIKQKKNYNPQFGDWEFAVVGGDKLILSDRGKLTKCQTCHEYAKSEGFVFRDYLFN